jgi:hypothetical protein
VRRILVAASGTVDRDDLPGIDLRLRLFGTDDMAGWGEVIQQADHAPLGGYVLVVDDLDVTELKYGDQVLGYLPIDKRYVGWPVDEFCVEQ